MRNFSDIPRKALEKIKQLAKTFTKIYSAIICQLEAILTVSLVWLQTSERSLSLPLRWSRLVLYKQGHLKSFLFFKVDGFKQEP